MVIGMNQWTKLFSGILQSTVWQEPMPTKIVWITMLALKDSEGRVEASIPGLAHVAGVALEECEKALERFLSPDPYSRSKEHEGRRIREIEGGWQVLNHFKYRDEKSDYRREYNRRKQAEYRAKKRVAEQDKPLKELPGEREAVRAWEEEGKEI